MVSVAGEIDVTNERQFYGQLAEAVPEGVPRVVVDLSGVSYLALAGVAVLTRMHRVLAAQGVELVLASPSRPAARVLSLLGTDQVVPVTAAAGTTVRPW
jgi:anti-sigma B factor antagonist